MLDQRYTLYVRSADGEFIHIMETKENKYFMYNSFQLKKVEHKMLNDSIIMFICDCIQIIVYNITWNAACITHVGLHYPIFFYP